MKSTYSGENCCEHRAGRMTGWKASRGVRDEVTAERTVGTARVVLDELATLTVDVSLRIADGEEVRSVLADHYFHYFRDEQHEAAADQTFFVEKPEVPQPYGTLFQVFRQQNGGHRCESGADEQNGDRDCFAIILV